MKRSEGMTILVVDDETDLVRLVRYNLEKEGYNVVTAYDGQEALSQARHYNPHLVILDLMLPDMPGFKICQTLKRSTPKLPVIMLTARSSEDDRVAGFEAGADDYVVKPFSPKELVCRVKALMARSQVSQKSSETVTASERIEWGSLVVIPSAFCVETTEGRPLSLSYIEFKLLLTLLESPNRVKTREALIAEIWQDSGEDLSDRTVDTHIKRLRQKLGDARSQIETIRGVGYRAIFPNAAQNSLIDTPAVEAVLLTSA